MKVTEPIFIWLSRANLKAFTICASTAGTFLSGRISVGHLYPVDGIVILLFDSSGFASTLQIFILVASPQCTDED
jgi:hypothetical protein